MKKINSCSNGRNMMLRASLKSIVLNIIFFYYCSKRGCGGPMKFDPEECTEYECWWDDADFKIFIKWDNDEQKKEITRLREEGLIASRIRYKRRKIVEMQKELKLEELDKEIKELDKEIEYCKQEIKKCDEELEKCGQRKE
jgi:peptidoglycan hydrolase CwlO-like protein